jgi:hypothetical protein
MPTLMPPVLALVQGLILLLVLGIARVGLQIRNELRRMNGKLIALEQWKWDRPCEMGRARVCPDFPGK